MSDEEEEDSVEIQGAYESAYPVIGELIVATSALDRQMNLICIALLTLHESPMLEPLVATLDLVRKIEILKAYSALMRKQTKWKSAMKKHSESLEKINRVRNIAAHSFLGLYNGRPILRQTGTAKLMKSIDLAQNRAEHVELSVLQDAIKLALETLMSGDVLRQNLERFAVLARQRHSVDQNGEGA